VYIHVCLLSTASLVVIFYRNCCHLLPRLEDELPIPRGLLLDSLSHRVFNAFAVRPVPKAFACSTTTQRVAREQTPSHLRLTHARESRGSTSTHATAEQSHERAVLALATVSVGGPSRSNVLGHAALLVCCGHKCTHTKKRQRTRNGIQLVHATVNRAAASMYEFSSGVLVPFGERTVGVRSHS
jgi:hypothetical protein